LDVPLRISSAISSNEIASLFAVAILAIGGIAVILRLGPWRETPFARRLVAVAPNILATLGILGTFVGILVGLLDFDVNRIDASVPGLLAGLKIAFGTSIVGMTAAIILRIVMALVPVGSASGGAGPEEVLSALREMRDDARAADRHAEARFERLLGALGGGPQATVAAELSQLRTELVDGQSRLTEEFRRFAEHMVENNQKALIEALERVIRDFNQQLTEQFGDNFKELNRAVHALVAWQENYRAHVEAMEERLAAATAAIETSRDALAETARHAERIPDALAPLEPLLTGLAAQVRAMEAHLEALAALREKAEGAFPIISDNLERISTSAAQLQERVEVSGKTMAGQFEAFDKAMQEELKTAVQRLGTELASLSGKFVSDYGPLTDRLREVVRIAEGAR
jgi:ABC-type transporter Mla subunit MlaD